MLSLLIHIQRLLIYRARTFVAGSLLLHMVLFGGAWDDGGGARSYRAWLTNGFAWLGLWARHMEI